LQDSKKSYEQPTNMFFKNVIKTGTFFSFKLHKMFSKSRESGKMTVFLP